MPTKRYGNSRYMDRNDIFIYVLGFNVRMHLRRTVQKTYYCTALGFVLIAVMRELKTKSVELAYSSYKSQLLYSEKITRLKKKMRTCKKKKNRKKN